MCASTIFAGHRCTAVIRIDQSCTSTFTEIDQCYLQLLCQLTESMVSNVGKKSHHSRLFLNTLTNCYILDYMLQCDVYYTMNTFNQRHTTNTFQEFVKCHCVQKSYILSSILQNHRCFGIIWLTVYLIAAA